MKSISSIAYDIANAAADKKGKDIRILNVEGLSSIADYFVICSGTSSVQVKAIADEIEEKLEDEGIYVKHKEGQEFGRWILLDYGNIIVHIFHEEEREFYSVERLWADAEEVQL